MEQKRFFYKIYGEDPTLWDSARWDIDRWDYGDLLLATWSKEIESEPRFRETLNGTASELVVKLMRPFNAYGEGDDVSFDNLVRAFVYGEEDSQPVNVFTGRISSYDPVMESNGSQYVEVTVLGIGQNLNDIQLEDADGNTSLEYIDQEPSDIIADILDKAALQGSEVRYTTTSLQDTGITTDYRFSITNIRDAIDKIVSLSPANYYWYIGADGILYFQQSDTDYATHKLTVGRELQDFRARKTNEQMVNTIYFVGGSPVGESQLYRKYTRPGSIATYGIHSRIVIDQRVTRTTTADRIAAKILDEYESPLTRLEATIKDDHNNTYGYDIETIHPGDTIQLGNLQFGEGSASLWNIATWDSSVWNSPVSTSLSEIMQIVSVEYGLDGVHIEAANRLPEVAARVEEAVDMIEDQILAEIPVTYVEV